MSTSKITKHFTLIITTLALFITISGCADLQGAINQTSAWRNKALAIETNTQTQLKALENKRQTTPDTSPDVPYLDAAIAKANAQISALNAAIAQADLVIEEAQNPTDSLTRAADAISPWVPAPAQGPLLLGAALAASMLRSRNLKQNTTSIIQSIDHLLKDDPQFKELFNNHANTIRTIQTPGARKLIDSTIKKSN